MEYGLLIARQIVVMFIILGIGAACYMAGIITKEGNKQISKLTLTVVNPVLIFMSYQTSEYNSELLNGLLWSFLLSAISFAVTILLAQFVIKKDTPDKAIERFSIIYSNCGFMGIPLINGIFGNEGVLYLTAYVTLFNLLAWTHGLMMMKGEKDFSSLVKALRSPAIISLFLGLVFYLAKLHIPDLLFKSFDYIGNMNTPLAMFCAGATVAQTNILKALKKPRTYLVTFYKLILVPVVTFAVLWFIPAPEIVKMVVTIAAGCSAATMCTMFAIQLDKNALRSSEIFAVSTLICAVTLPLVTLAGSVLLQYK